MNPEVQRFVESINRSLDRQAPRITRRRFIQIFGGLAIGSFAGGFALVKACSNEKLQGKMSLPEGGRKPEMPDNSIVYDQLDTKWQKDPTWGDGKSSCGPTTVAMVLSRFGDKDMTPDKVDRIFQQKKIRVGRNGDTLFRSTDPQDMSVLHWLAQEKGYEVVRLMDHLYTAIDFPFVEAQKRLAQGYLIVGSGMVKWLREDEKDQSGGPWDHIFGISKVDTLHRTYTTFDPWKKKVKERGLSEAQLWYLYALRLQRGKKN